MKLTVTFSQFCERVCKWSGSTHHYQRLMKLTVTNRDQLHTRESKTAPVQNHEGIWMCGGKASCILNLLTTAELSASRPSYFKRVPIDQEAECVPRKTAVVYPVYGHMHRQWFRFAIVIARLKQKQIYARNRENRCHKT